MNFSKDNEAVRNIAKLATGVGLAVVMAFSARAYGQEFEKVPTGKGAPKYVFVFVGDGMSYPQIQSAAYFTGKDAAGIVDTVKNHLILQIHLMEST